MAAEDAKRLGGELPNSFSPGKRVMLVRRPRGVVGVISPWNWPYTMPAELVAPALACGNAVVWTPAPSTAVCAVALARVHRRRRPAAGRVQPRDRARRRRRRRDRAQPGHRRRRPSSARPRPAGSSPQAAAGKAALLEMGGNGPLVVMDDADVDAAVEATLTACYLCAGQSCTAGERILVHRARARRVRRAARAARDRADPARRPVRRRDHDGPAQQRARGRRRWTSTSATRVERGASVVTGGARATGFPTDLYWQPTVLAGVPRRRRAWPSRRRSARSPRSSRSTRSSTRSSWPTPRPTGCWRRSSPATCATGCEFADRVRTGWVNINESTQLLGGPPPVRRPRGYRQRHRPGRRRAT